MKKIIILIGIFLLIYLVSVTTSRQIIISKITYKKTLVNQLFNMYPDKKDYYYTFNANLELAKYNAWVDRCQYLYGIWYIRPLIPEEIMNENYYRP